MPAFSGSTGNPSSELRLGRKGIQLIERGVFSTDV